MNTERKDIKRIADNTKNRADKRKNRKPIWHFVHVAILILILVIVNAVVGRHASESITNLTNNSYADDYINWTWTDPKDISTNFFEAKVYIDEQFMSNVHSGVQYYNATNLDANSRHTISTQTVDIRGNKVNSEWTTPTAATPTATPTVSDILAKIQPLLVPANMINIDKPLVNSGGHETTVYVYKLPGTNPPVLVVQSSGVIDCDGQTTPQCNINTDPWFQEGTTYTQSDGQPLIASVLPYYVLPAKTWWDWSIEGIHGGQLGLIMYGDKKNYGVLGDVSGSTYPANTRIGEMSYAFAASIGLNPDPHYGGITACCNVTYIYFTWTGNVVSPIEDHSKAVTMGDAALNLLMQQLGG